MKFYKGTFKIDSETLELLKNNEGIEISFNVVDGLSESVIKDVATECVMNFIELEYKEIPADQADKDSIEVMQIIERITSKQLQD